MIVICDKHILQRYVIAICGKHILKRYDTGMCHNVMLQMENKMRGRGDRVKEKVSLLARGIFEYENPEIVVSEEKIDIKVEAGKLYEGSFDVNSVNGLEIRTKIFSSHKLMKLKSNDYIKSSIHVTYTFDALALTPDTVVEGHFSIISNGGELEIPFTVNVCKPFCHTSIGPINDLAQFTNLAQANWHEAVKLFRTPNFSRVFLRRRDYAHIYDMLIQSRNMNQAMEEFLCTIKRKRSIDIRISQESIDYENLTEVTSERLVIEKDNWGYQKIYVSTIGDFIQVYKKELTTEDFLGSYYELEYVIDPAFFKYGNNYGKIIIKTINKTIEIDVSCVKSQSSYQMDRRKSVKESVYELYSNFMKLQMGRIDKAQWVRATRESVDCCRNRSKDAIYALYEAHFLILNERKVGASEILNGINGRELRHKSVKQYCYYLYLNSLCRNDISYTRFAKDKIEGYYDGPYSSWEILWMKFKISDKIMPSRKYAMIKTEFEKGCRSPLMYWEAIKIVNDEPSLLREFERFEIQLVAWAVQNECIGPKVVHRFADIAASGRFYSDLALKTLIRLDEIYGRKEILAGICALLIRGNKLDDSYNRWYRLGIESSLRQQGLYENYIYSLDMSKDETLPVGVLIYFNYDNQLTVDKKAFLYAYVIRHKDKHPKIYNDYENIMKAFTHEQLGKGYINESMVVLYQHFIKKDKINSKIAAQLPNVLFKREVIVNNPWISHVIVSHREVDRTLTYKVQDGRAFVDIYMEEYYFTFVDKMDYRYTGTIEYEVKNLIDEREFLKTCAQHNGDNSMILLNRSERAIKYQRSDEVSIDMYKRTLRLPNVGKQFQKNILKNLIDFYYDNYEGETLEKYLLQLDISMLDGQERGKIIEYYIQRGLYDLAYDAIKVYGFDKIQDKKIMRLCSRKIKENHFENDPLLREMAYFAFTCGKYDDCILEYLIKYYLGTTKDLYAIWVAAKNFEVEAFELEGKILCQMIFAESFITNVFAVFESYYQMRPEPKIVKAFLAYYSYKYLVKEEAVDEKLFEYLEMEYDQMNSAADVCSLALLKYYSQSQRLIQMRTSWIVSMVEKYIERGMILPFFKNFAGLEQLPGEILDKTYISYKTNPKNTVTIYYMIVEDGREQTVYTEEEMSNVFGGIFVKALTLFDDEKLKYYIREKSELAQSVTEGMIVDGESIKPVGKDGRTVINHMISLAGEGNMDQLKDELQRYEEQRYLTKKLFTLIS